MADKKENNKPLLPTKPPRGNYQIWVILATVAVIFGVMYFNNSSSLKDVDYDAFKQMVKSGDVKKVVLVQNRKFVEVTLKSEALQNAKYKDQLNNGTFGSGAHGPHFVMKVVDAGNFDQEFRFFAINFPQISHQNIKQKIVKTISRYLFNGDSYSCCCSVSGC